MPKVKLELDKPLTGALQYISGRHYESTIPGKRGSMMYTLASGDVIFLDTDICDEPDQMFRNADIGAGDTFTLTLRKRNGQRFYELRKKGDSFEEMPTTLPPSRLESQLEASIKHVADTRRAQTANQAPATQPDSTQHEMTGHTNSATVASQMVASSLIAAIDGLLIAREYAESKGLPMTIDLDFNGEDIRTIANCMYIQATKNGMLEQKASNVHAAGYRQ